MTHANISLTLSAAAAVGPSNIAGVASKSPFGLYGRRVWADRVSLDVGCSRHRAARVVVPTMEWLSDVRVNQWIMRFPVKDPLVQQHNLLLKAAARIRWASAHSQHLAVCSGLRLLLTHGYEGVNQIQDEDLKNLSLHYSKGMECARCSIVFVGCVLEIAQAWINTP